MRSDAVSEEDIRVAKRNKGPASDEGETEEEVEDENDDGDLRMSQLHTPQEKGSAVRSVISREADVGILEKITLVNFMCHKRFDIQFGPNVNFILGKNGSGKSAIMNAVVVALGGKATATQRGTSLKQFVQSGASHAEVIIHLRNRGQDAYRHDVYGDTIVVERHIRSDGTGTYKLKSGGNSGTVVSTKKDELQHMLDHLNIQIDNPVSLLSQETSRNFLHSSNPHNKYKLFMKATQLEKINQDYEAIIENLEEMKRGIERKKHFLPQVEQDAKQLEERLQEFQALEGLEKKLLDLKKELQWSVVAQLEQSIEPYKADTEKEKQRLARNQAKFDQTKTLLAGFDAQSLDLNQKLESAFQKASAVNMKREPLSSELREKQKKVRDAEHELRSLDRQLVDKNREMKALENKRDESIALSQRDIKGERLQKTQQLEENRAKLKQLEDVIKTVENDRNQFEKASEKTSSEVTNNEEKVQQLVDDTVKCEEEVRRLRSSQKDRLEAFGHWMPRLVSLIQQNQSHFRKLPKGPIGALIKLKDYRWTTAIEQVIGYRNLMSFICDNHDDEATLKRLINENTRDVRGPRPDIIVARFTGRAYDVSQSMARCSYPTVLQMLEVPDPDIQNCLIDLCSVEETLLIESAQDARREMNRKIAKQAYTLEGDFVQYMRFYSKPRDRYGTRSILRADVDGAIQDETMKLNGLKEELSTLRQNVTVMKENLNTTRRHASQAKARLVQLQKDRSRCTALVNDLQAALEEDNTQEDIATYDGEIDECRKVIAELVEQKQDKERHLKEAEGNLRQCQTEIQAHESSVEEIATEIEELRAKVVEIEQQQSKVQGVAQQYERRIAEINSGLADLENKVTELTAKIKVAVEKAEEACEKIVTKRDPKSIEREMEKLKQKVKEKGPGLAEKHDVQQKYIEVTNRLKDLANEIAGFKRAHKAMIDGYKKRKEKYICIRDLTAHRAKLCFQQLLSRRGYEGKLKINFENETLLIPVQVDNTEKASVTKNTLSLSGGERSFTTVCFIMSLWDAMEAPFRILDEFDVFMDMLNRKIAMTSMLKYAEEQPQRQFIFLTPQDMSDLGSSRQNVRIMRLHEPDRSQTTLDEAMEDTT